MNSTIVVKEQLSEKQGWNPGWEESLKACELHYCLAYIYIYIYIYIYLVYMPHRIRLCRQILYSLVAQTTNSLPAMQEIWLPSQGWEDPLEKGMATQFTILAWKIPWMEEPGGPQSMRSPRVRHDWVTNTHSHSYHLITSIMYLKFSNRIKKVGMRSQRIRYRVTKSLTLLKRV